MLSREEILNAQDLKAIEVKVPEWGGSVLVRMMTGTERDHFEREQYELSKIGKLGDNARARLVARVVVGEDNKPIFTSDDVTKLGERSSAALERIVRAASRLNKLDVTEVEQVAKNSEPSPGASSS